MSRPVRVLFVHHRSELGGAPTSLYYLIRELDRSRFEPHVYCPSGPAADLFRSAGATVHTGRVAGFTHIWASVYRGRRWALLVRELLRLPGHLWRFSRRAKRGGFDLVHVNDSPPVAAAWLARRARIPVVWHLRSALPRDGIDARSRLLRRAIRRYADVVVAINRDVARVFAVDAEIVPNAIDLGVFAPGDATEARAAAGLDPGRPVVSYFGFLYPAKGFNEFIEAAATVHERAPTATFLIVGGGVRKREFFRTPTGRLLELLDLAPDYESRARELVAERGLEGVVRFMPFTREPERLYRASDIVVAPSRGPELGRPVIEAAATGVPVVASGSADGGGIIRPGETGLLVNSSDPQLLAGAVTMLLESPARAAVLGRAAREHAEQEFSPEVNARRIERVYERLLRRHAAVQVPSVADEPALFAPLASPLGDGFAGRIFQGGALFLAGGLALAIAAPLAAPTSETLPSADGLGSSILAAAALFVAFVAGYRRPVKALYALIVVAIAEGAVRRWIVNDLSIFLLKDFLALGIYAAVLPRLGRGGWRRPWWLLAPLAGLVILAAVSAGGAESAREAVIGLRSYIVYVPLLWVAPAIITTRARGAWLLVVVLAAGALESALAFVQAIAGPGVLNKLVSGAKPAIVTVNDRNYIRPAGSFMQVGSFSGFLLFFMLAAFSSIVWARTGRLYWLAIAGAGFLAWGVVYSSARAVLGSLVVTSAALAVALIWRRRIRSLLAVGAAFGAGMIGVFLVLPLAGASTGAGSSGYLGRAADINKAGDKGGGLIDRRVRPQLDLIGDQGLVGHGTGAMTLGTGYASEEATFPGEGQYSKVAYELGLPGLALFLWASLALLAACVMGVLRSDGWQRAAALVGAGAAAILPFWYLIAFMLDVPIVGILFWTFAGIAVAARAAPRPPEARA